MTPMTELLNLEIYKYILIFLRVGSALMLMPGFMTTYVNTRQRLCIALAVTVVLSPFLSPLLPPAPTDFAENLRLGFIEITYGVILGLAMQCLYFALSLAGSFAGQAIGFSNAQLFDPTTQSQSIVLESFLSITALTVIFVTDLHHIMLSAVIDSYRLFPVGQSLMYGDWADFFAKTVNDSFVVGFQVASPFIAFTIIFYCGMGLVSRLMPQLNIFFLSLPLQIYLGLGLLFITTPIMILWFLRYFENGLHQFLQ